MHLNRRAKARIFSSLDPQRMLFATLVLGAAAIGWHILAFVALAFGSTLPTQFVGVAFFPILPVALFRWWAIHQGWAPVRVNELKHLDAIFPDPSVHGDSEPTMPAALQASLADAIHHKGWLAWSEVLSIARAHGVEGLMSDWAFMLGGSGAAVARRKDWRKVLSDYAWMNGHMARNLPEPDHTQGATRSRF